MNGAPTIRPAAVIFGAPRSGTTSLWRYLAPHPEIAPSRVKELDFFKTEGEFAPGAYDAQFSPKGALTLEASPVYFREHAAIVPRLSAALPAARLACVLREPAARLFASYRGERDWQARIAPDMTFERYARIVTEGSDPGPIFPADPAIAAYVRDGSKVGLYADILGHYFARFDPARISVQFLDDLIAAPRAAVEATCRHIGVDPAALPEIDFRPENQGADIRNPRLFRIARAVNLALEPALNRVPAARRGLKSLHHFLNGAPRGGASDDEEAGRAILRAWYAPANRRLGELLLRHYPAIRLPAWITDAR